MPSLNFPNNPSLNQIYTANNTTWQWNGTSWVRSNAGVQGVQGTQGLQGTQGVQGTTGDTYWEQGPSGIHTTQNVGIATTSATSYALDVYGDARVTGILTVGSSTVVIDGNNNTINVGTGVTIHTTTSTFNQIQVSGASTFVGDANFTGNLTVGGELKYEDVINVDSIGIATARSGLRITDGGLVVAGVSTFTGIGTFSSDVYVDGTIFAPAINIQGGATLSDDIDTRNVNATGIITASSFDGDLNALGKTYYVATTGNDSNSGDNINEPFLTISQALSVATNGDVINISAGTYEETVPLTVPRGVTVKGAGLRATTIRPSDATKTNNVFLLNDVSTVEDFTIRNSYYNSSADTGYAFAYAPGIAITTRSPYIQRVTVLNTGSTVTTTDPYGYDTPDSPPTTYIAGRGAKVDGSLVASNSLEAGMLFNEATFFTPNNAGVVLTNGARAEYLNCFHYFSSQAIVGTSGTVGIAGTAETRLKFRTPSVTPAVNDVVKLFDSGGSVVAVGTITNYNDPYARISGKGYGTFTSVGIGTTQRVEFYQSDGVTQTGIASAISLADYTMFGAEMRSVGCAVEYGDQGVIANGPGVQLRLFAMNFNHVGTGKDFSNDPTLVVQANEVVETNGGQVSYVSIDQSGDFRVGDSLYINQETGQVSFASTTYDLENVGNLVVTDGVSNQTLITPTSLTVGNLQLAANTVSSVSGDINLNPAGANKTIISGDLNVTGGNFNLSGISTFTGIGTFQSDLYVGGTLYAPSLTIEGGATLGDDLSTRNISASGIVTVTGSTDLNGDLDVDGHTELDNVNISGIATAYDLDVDGHTELDNVNVSGVSTFVGIGTFSSDLYVGGALDVDGNINFNGLLFQDNEPFIPSYWVQTGAGIHTLGSVGIGTTNPVGSLEVSGHTELDDLRVSGVSTFTGIGTFSSDLYVGGDLYASSLNITDGASLGEDIITRNLSASGIVTVTGSTDLNGDLDVDGHTELDNVNIAGVLTATSAEFSGNVTVLGDLTYENVTNVDAIGIATARAGLRVTGGGLDVVGVSTFNNQLNASTVNVVSSNTYKINGTDVLSPTTLGSGVVNSSLTGVGTLTSLDVGGDLDVDGHAEFDNVNVSGIITATLFEGSSQIGIQSGGLQIGVGITTLNFVGAGNSILVNSSDPTIIDISIAGNTGAGGTWSSYVAGIATTKSVGINTDNLDEPGLTGIGNSFKGLYISNGMIIHDNVLTGNHYIGTAFNGLMAGPVDVQGVLTIDGAWVVV